MHTSACSNTPQIRLHLAITCFYQVVKAAGVCSTVRNAKERYNELPQVKHWCQSHTFLTVPHMPAAFVTLQQHVIAKCGRICRVLEYAQVCTIRTSALTWWSSL